MGAAERVLTLLLNRRLGCFEETSANPVEAQIRVLRALLRRAASTEYGRKFRFDELKSAEMFRQRVPVSRYEEFAPLWHRAFSGETDIAWPGHVKYFAVSSGSTAGNKWLPVTADAIRSNKRSGALLLAFLARRGGARNLLSGKFFYLGGSTTFRRQGKSWLGDASAIMMRHIPLYARRRCLPDRRVAAISDWEEKIRTIVKLYLREDVRALSACPSWAVLLFKDMLNAADSAWDVGRKVGELWPRLTWFVSYGMAFSPYRTAFDEFIGRPIEYIDTYSSSEAGMSAIQEEPGGPLRLIVDNGVFYEFVPAEGVESANPARLHIGEVSEGRDYALVISTNGGIWAYPLGDVVRFETLNPPRVVFSRRTQMYLSAFGEHVTMEMIDNAMAHACGRTGARVVDFTVSPVYPTARESTPAHCWVVEFERAPDSLAEFGKLLDESIRAVNEDYDTHRHGGYGMAPPRVVAVAPRTFYEWMKRRNKLGGQHKVPRVAPSPAIVDELLAISSEAATGGFATATPGSDTTRQSGAGR